MTIDEAIKDLEYGTKQLEMEIKSGLWIKGSESELRCKEGITLNKQHIEWLKELKDLRKENKVLIQKCDRLIKENGVDVQPVKHGEWIFQGRRDEDGRNIYRCSGCNFEVGVFPCNFISWRTHEKYCPGCGARMDGDSE